VNPHEFEAELRRLLKSASVRDNAQCVALVEGKPGGLIWLLEDECDLQRRAKPDHDGTEHDDT
jgi:hypothetical protein